MLTHLLDTDICIYAMKNRSPALAARFRSHDGQMAISAISLFELYYGADRYADPAARVAEIEAFTARLEVLLFDGRAARHAGQIRSDLRRRGEGIGAYDVQIAGLARSQGLILVTNNLREFERVDGMRTERWP